MAFEMIKLTYYKVSVLTSTLATMSKELFLS